MEELRELEKDKVIKHSLKCDTPLHVHGKIRNKERDQEKVMKEKEHCQ